MQRLKPYEGQRVSVADLSHSQIALANGIANRIKDLWNAGVATGLTVFESNTTSRTLAVTLGSAYNANGERVRADQLQDLIKYEGALLNAAAGTYYVNARYSESHDAISVLDVDGTCQYPHIIDSYSLKVLKSGVETEPSTDIRLSDVIVTAPGSTLIFETANRDEMSLKNIDYDKGIGSLVIRNTLEVGSTIEAVSNISTQGDFVNTTSGKGLIVLSPDGSKKARVGIDDSGFLGIEPLNYSF